MANKCLLIIFKYIILVSFCIYSYKIISIFCSVNEFILQTNISVVIVFLLTCNNKLGITY